MPIFEYRCNDCGTVSEFLVGVSQETPAIQCSSCGSSKLEKMLSASNFVSKQSAPIPAGCETCCGSGEPHEAFSCAKSSYCPRG
jgi:putative FmdB family regulatory protein